MLLHFDFSDRTISGVKIDRPPANLMALTRNRRAILGLMQLPIFLNMEVLEVLEDQ